MTQLQRRVKRSVRTPKGAYTLIIEPGPDPTIEVREKRRRKGYQIPVGVLYTMLAVRAADLARAHRRRRRGGLL